MHDAPGLEFPDWSKKPAHRSRMTFEEAVRWNEEALALFPPKQRGGDSRTPCPVEFVL
jgi:hypothetical protein